MHPAILQLAQRRSAPRQTGGNGARWFHAVPAGEQSHRMIVPIISSTIRCPRNIQAPAILQYLTTLFITLQSLAGHGTKDQ